MSNVVVTKLNLERLLGCVADIHVMAEDGVLSAALFDHDVAGLSEIISALDKLVESSIQVRHEQKIVSPFLRYRREILADTPAGQRLRMLVLNLYSEAQAVSLRRIFEALGEHEMRVALECIAHFADNGDRDSQFMSLAMEIAEAISHEAVEVAA